MLCTVITVSQVHLICTRAFIVFCSLGGFGRPSLQSLYDSNLIDVGGVTHVRLLHILGFWHHRHTDIKMEYRLQFLMNKSS